MEELRKRIHELEELYYSAIMDDPYEDEPETRKYGDELRTMYSNVKDIFEI